MGKLVFLAQLARVGIVWVAVLVVLLTPCVIHSQDYTPRSVPAVLDVDADTTFLVDFSVPKSGADYSKGSPQLRFGTTTQVRDGACTGPVSFLTGGNLPTNAWTIEMIIRVPASAAALDAIPLGRWNNSKAGFTFELVLQKGFGVRTRMYVSEFYVQPYAGGNARSIQNSATDKWVYIAFGCDFAAQQCMASARELTGELLNQDVNFASSPWMDTRFLEGLSQTAQQTAIANTWASGARAFAQTMPAEFSIGNTNVQVRAIRISNRYHSELFGFEAQMPTSDDSTWMPTALDANRASTLTVNRSVGYPGYNNFRTIAVEESYLPLAPGAQAVTINVGNLPVGLYSLFVYGSIDAKGRTSLPRVWQPCPMAFEARIADGSLGGKGKLLLKQSFYPRRMQGFHFHVDKPGTVTATLSVPASALETPWIQKVVLVDQLEGVPDVAIKSSQNLAFGSRTKLTSLTDARKSRDTAIWNTLPPLNTHLQVHDQVTAFRTPPTGVHVDDWQSKTFLPLPYTSHFRNTFEPLDFTNRTSGGVFSQASILAGVPWPGKHQDDGAGTYFPQSSYPVLTAHSLYNARRAELLGYRYYLFYEALVDDPGTSAGLKLPLNYFRSGDANVGHDAALALVRWAYDWPALEMSFHEMRLCTHAPDLDWNTDWSSERVRNGKMYYDGWSGQNAVLLMTAYDQVFPYIQNNQVFADAVNRFIPWVRTPQDVVRFLDRYLVSGSVKDFREGLIRAANVEDVAAAVLGPHSLTADLFDLTKQAAEIYPASGTYQEMYATALSRSGVYYSGSFMVYGFGGAQELIAKAHLQREARENGVQTPMDLSDVFKYPKVKSAGDFLTDMWVAGGFPFMAGDASGGTHSGREAEMRLGMAKTAVSQAFDLYSSPKHAWVLKNLLGDTRSEVAAAAGSVDDPIMHAASRVVPDYGAVLEMNPGEVDPLKKTAATLRLGIGQGHSHNDYLDLNFFSMGLPVAVDLACRNEGSYWSRPGANWSFLHNHALAHPSDDPNGAATQTGEPWLRAFAPPVVRASYIDKAGGVLLDRDLVLMRIGNSNTYYAFDVQRLRGGAYHTWAFHGCESENVQVNVPMQTQTVRWTDRLLEGTQKVGTAPSKLQATWTMTRSAKAYAHNFNGGGTVQTVACEPQVLGSSFNAALPPVSVRATLLGRQNDTVLQGNPYSEDYAYCFPFLWVQSSGSEESVYPAIYEWYRGTPVVSNAVILSSAPLQVQVTTASGQIDTYESTANYLLAVSRNQGALRWAKLSGSTAVNVPGLSLIPGPDHNVTIVDIDYLNRSLTTSHPLPANPEVVAGNNGRRVFLKLRGSGNTFFWDDDLLVHEGQLTSVQVTAPDTVALVSNQQPLFGDAGNRHAEAMTVTSEDSNWHFRGGKLIKAPVGGTLSREIFTDANGDGFVNVKTQEIGVGDTLSVPAEIEIEVAAAIVRVKANVSLSGSIAGTQLNLAPSPLWQEVRARVILPPPVNLRY